MRPAVTIDVQTISMAVVAVFTLMGVVQGGARSILVVGVSLATIVGLGEPVIASSMLSVGTRVYGVMRRALGTTESAALTDPGPYYFLVYLLLLISAILLSRGVVREPGVSKSSRLFGGALGVLNGLLFSLMLRENLLPSLGRTLGHVWTIQVQLQPELAAQSLPLSDRISVGTVAYVFGLLLAGAGLIRKVRGARGPGL